MACKTSYELHHNFPKIAEDSGFTFNIHRPRMHLDWNKIRSIDVDKVIRDRRFSTIEQSINHVLDCVLESEFDVRILDEGVVKLFRLAQLTIEYQQFCRHHLDRSVILLREEVVSIMQEIEKNKKELRNKDEEIRKLRKKTKHIYKPSLQYGNDNIAAMILKTLSNNDLASPGMGDRIQHYNKCKFCDKVFLNQLYLKGHILRRHPAAESNHAEAEQKTDQTQQYVLENSKLRNEIEELKNKLEDMRLTFVKTESKLSEMETERKNEVPTNDKKDDVQENVFDEKNILEKFEEWKLEEHQKYKSEISLLREQILENINAIKDNRLEGTHQQDLEIIQPLHNIIKEQSTEIVSLKQELTRAIKNIEDINKNKELEVKKRIQSLPLHIDASQQYENLSNGCNSPQKPQYIRQKTISHLSDAATCTDSPEIKTIAKQTSNNKDHIIEDKVQNNFMHKRQKSLEELHRKTQELLNTVSSSDTSSSDENHTPFVYESKRKTLVKQNTPTKHVKEKNDVTPSKVKQNAIKLKQQKKYKSNNIAARENINKKPKREKRDNININKQECYENEDSFSGGTEEDMVHSSPAKIVRAKITEEVNKRLVTVGVDPLKTGLKNDMFKKQRAHLQHEEEVKKKKSPSYEKTRHKILAFLDSKAAEETEATHAINNSINGDKLVRNFKFTSVLSNVKNKALSLLKSSDRGNVLCRKTITDGTKGETMLRTPSPVSPVRQRRASIDNNTRNTTTKVREASKEMRTNQRKAVKVEVARHKTNYETDSDEKDSIDQIYEEKKNIYRQSNKSIDSLINSPIKRPATADMVSPIKKYINTDTNLIRTQSAVELLETPKLESNIPEIKRYSFKENYKNSNGESTKNKTKKFLSDENIFVQSTQPGTRGVLKNAPSNSSLSKKKVLFDLDANQTKSVSVSPSPSTSEQKDPNIDAIESVNLEDEWDISSIESHPVRASHENLTSKTNTKVAELTQRIESQLARRGDHKPPGAGSVDLIRGPATGGSNTSLGSSLLDDTEEPYSKHHPDNVSDIDLSEFSVDGLSKDYKVK